MRRRTRLLISLTMMSAIALLFTATVGQDMMAQRSPDLGSFALLHGAGYLFFILMPVELLIPYYQAAGHPEHVLFVLAVGTACIAQAVDLGIGWALSGSFIEGMIGEVRHRKASATMERYGAWAIFGFNLFPLSSPILLLVAGMMRFNPWKALLVSLAGLSGKYLLLIYLGRDIFNW